MQIKGIKELFGTKWLSFKEATYFNKEEKEMKWNFISRKGDTKIITVICRSKNTENISLFLNPACPLIKS